MIYDQPNSQLHDDLTSRAQRIESDLPVGERRCGPRAEGEPPASSDALLRAPRRVEGVPEGVVLLPALA